MKKLVMMMALIASMFIMNGCDSDDFGEREAMLLSEAYPEIFMGLQGEPGDSAYEVAVSEGYEGNVTSWLESLIGTDGVCPDCEATIDPVDPVENGCLVSSPPEVEDDLVHIIVWYTRDDIVEPTFEHYVIVDGFPTLRGTVYPGADDNHTMEDVNGTTVLMGQYVLEDNETKVHAVGVQFNQVQLEEVVEDEE